MKRYIKSQIKFYFYLVRLRQALRSCALPPSNSRLIPHTGNFNATSLHEYEEFDRGLAVGGKTTRSYIIVISIEKRQYPGGYW